MTTQVNMNGSERNRGSSLQAHVVIVAVVAVVSALGVTGLVLRGADRPERERAVEDAGAAHTGLEGVALDALERGLADLRGGGTGELDGDCDLDHGWRTRRTDFGDSLILRASAYADGEQVIAEAYVDTAEGVEVTEQVLSRRPR